MFARLLVFNMYHFTPEFLILGPCKSQHHSEYSKPKPSAFFIFGDSTVDPGNNNYITSTPENRANYKPYGQNGFFDAPTGRFSNGRVSVDFIAVLISHPVDLESFLKQIKVIDLPTQLKNFELVRKSLAKKHGDYESKRIISKAVYFVSIGSNDYLGGYLASPKMQELHQPQAYVEMVIQNMTRSIQFLYEKGARKFGFLSLTPLGCLPALRAANPVPNANGACFEQANMLAMAHNDGLSAVLENLQQGLKGFKYSNTQFYNWFQDRINYPFQHGFKDGVNACRGMGPYRGTNTCGGTKSIKHYDLCDEAADYVWWDSYHATEKLHEQVAEDLWDGPASFVGPYSLKSLFFV